jgi:isopentenyl-diphosphate delta-isomerase
VNDVLERVVLVDAEDRELGTAAKLDAHRSGSLHRAFSVFVFDRNGRLLLQQRALSKYHSGGLWANACCSHPRPGEAVLEAARRRLREELGVSCTLEPVFGFVYRASLDNGLIEHEYDHVLVGRFEGTPEPDPREVADWRWAEPAELAADLAANPGRYAAWLPPAFAELQRRTQARLP